MGRERCRSNVLVVMPISLSLKAFNVSENAISTTEDENALRLVHVIFFEEAFPASQLMLLNKPYFLVNKIYKYIFTA